MDTKADKDAPDRVLKFRAAEAEYWERVRAAHPEAGPTLTAFVRGAVLEKLVRLEGGSPPPVHVPAEPVGPAEAAPEPAPRQAVKGAAPRRSRFSAGPDADPPASGSPAPSSPHASGPAAAPPADANRIPAAPAAEPSPGPDAPTEVSSWTCGRCHVTMPLVDRWTHNCAGKAGTAGRESGEALRHEASEQSERSDRTKVKDAAAKPAASAFDLGRLEDFVVTAVGTGRLPENLAKGKEVPYLLAVARRGLEAQHVAEDLQPEDDVLEAWVRKLGSKSSAVKRILEG